MGVAVLDRTVVHVPDLQANTEFTGIAAIRADLRSLIVVPLLRSGDPIGAIGISHRAVDGFSDEAIALLQTFADQGVIAIENARLFSELHARTRDLAEALTQQTTTSEILSVIAGSPTDLQPVLDALVTSAGRLCEAAATFLLLVEGDQLRVAALHGAEEVTIGFSNPIHRGWLAGRAVVDARAIHVEDLASAEAEAEFPLGHGIAVRFGHRTAFATPLFREGTPIGVLFLRRREARRFSDKEIALLKTFADQAVIAIENVRLFKELQARNADLTRVARTADGDGARSFAVDLQPRRPTFQPVFDAIARSAGERCAERCSERRSSLDGDVDPPRRRARQLHGPTD